MNDTSFIVDSETTWGYYPIWVPWIIYLAIVFMAIGLIIQIIDIIHKADNKKANKRAMDLVRKCGIESVNPSIGLIALRKEIKAKIEECQVVEEEFRKILAQIDKILNE